MDPMDDKEKAAQAKALQNRLYFLLEKLQDMTKELQPKYQQRISHELLSGLANSLLHDTIFEIVKALKDIQDVTEKHLFQSRLQLSERHNSDRLALKDILKNDQESYAKQKAVLLEKQAAELLENDKNIVAQMDERVRDQQEMLEKAGVPGFYVTSDPIEVKVQMYLLKFIWNLTKLELPPGMVTESSDSHSAGKNHTSTGSSQVNSNANKPSTSKRMRPVTASYT